MTLVRMCVSVCAPKCPRYGFLLILLSSLEHRRCTYNTLESVRIIRTSFCKAGLENAESVEKNVLQFQSWYEMLVRDVCSLCLRLWLTEAGFTSELTEHG